MLGDVFLLNLVIFLLGQVAAWGYLRTGRIGRGVALMIGGWLLADVALVMRVAFEYAGPWYEVCVALLQLYSLIELALFAFGRWRRRSPRARSVRGEAFARALRHYMRNELDEAFGIYRMLVRADPWDRESRLGLATVLARLGRRSRAVRALRMARALDLDARFADVIADELSRLKPRSPDS